MEGPGLGSHPENTWDVIVVALMNVLLSPLPANSLGPIPRGPISRGETDRKLGASSNPSSDNARWAGLLGAAGTGERVRTPCPG